VPDEEWGDGGVNEAPRSTRRCSCSLTTCAVTFSCRTRPSTYFDTTPDSRAAFPQRRRAPPTAKDVRRGMLRRGNGCASPRPILVDSMHFRPVAPVDLDRVLNFLWVPRTGLASTVSELYVVARSEDWIYPSLLLASVKRGRAHPRRSTFRVRVVCGLLNL